MTPLYRLIGAACMVSIAFPALAAGDIDAGLALYQTRCAACHSLDYNGVGPAHRGVFGRQAAQASGFAYSDALKASHVVWDEASLDRWLADPEKFAPGQRMGISVPEVAARRDLIAYLKQAAAAKK